MPSSDDAVSIELIKKAFTSKYYPDLFGGESTHSSALALVAQLVRFTDDEELLFEIVRSGLPENYDGDTLEEISSMVRGAIWREQSYWTPRPIQIAGIEGCRTCDGESHGLVP